MASPTLPVRPFRGPVDGAVRLPGSKSLTNRALVLAALHDGPVRVEGALDSRDTRLMVAALRALGLRVESDPAARLVVVHGQGGRLPVAEAAIDVGNAGTVARFLVGLLATRAGGRYRLDGDPAMRRRPMRGLTDALASIGAGLEFHGEPGCFPFTLRPRGLPAGEVVVDASASSQLLSALLLAAPAATGPLVVRLAGTTVSAPFVTLTADLLREAGVDVRDEPGGAFRIAAPAPVRFAGGVHRVEPDATAASYFLALPAAVGGRVALPGLPAHPRQGDAAFADVLGALGVAVDRGPTGWTARRVGPPAGGDVDLDFNAFSDTFLTLAALAPLRDATTTIRGIAHTRHQETDRVAAMATELRRLGQDVEETADGDALVIRGSRAALRRAALGGALPVVETYEDHRVAMSFGILASHDLRGDGEPWLAIADPACTGKTFPDFFDVLESLRPPG